MINAGDFEVGPIVGLNGRKGIETVQPHVILEEIYGGPIYGTRMDAAKRGYHEESARIAH